MADNALNVTLPTTVGGSGGFTLNYNFGGSTDAIANGAYSFLNDSFSADNAFLGGSISGTQGFLAHQTAPILSAVGQQETTYAGLMPGLFNNLFSLSQQTQANQMQTINAGMAYQNNIAIDSISASKKASKSGGLCFITTAVCESLLLPDDNEYLNKLRAFRDNYMSRSERTQVLVKRYYEIAPKMVDALNKRKDSAAVYCYLFTHFILPAVDAIDRGDAEDALAMYSAMVAYVEVKAYGNE
jgi:hypothetical protein